MCDHGECPAGEYDWDTAEVNDPGRHGAADQAGDLDQVLVVSEEIAAMVGRLSVVRERLSQSGRHEEEVAMVTGELYRRVPGTVAPARGQAQGAWAAVSALRQEFEYPLIVGAYTAAEWTLQVTDLRPLARARLTAADVARLARVEDGSLVRAADEDCILEELQSAIDMLNGSEDDPYARGVYVWLAWWVGVRDLPEEFVPASPAFEQLRAG